MLEPLQCLLLFALPHLELQKPMVEQPQLDANLQLNQREPAIPNQTQYLVHRYPAHLH